VITKVGARKTLISPNSTSSAASSYRAVRKMTSRYPAWPNPAKVAKIACTRNYGWSGLTHANLTE
jgi:hypothetical protein